MGWWIILMCRLVTDTGRFPDKWKQSQTKQSLPENVRDYTIRIRREPEGHVVVFLQNKTDNFEAIDLVISEAITVGNAHEELNSIIIRCKDQLVDRLGDLVSTLFDSTND